MSSALKLPGSLAVTKASLNAVGSLLDENVDFNVATAARDSADGSDTFVYFIQADADINSKVSYVASSDRANGDDAYALGQVSIASASALNPLVKLPTGAGAQVPAGKINARDATNGNASLGEFPVMLTISCNDQGVLSSSVLISGSDVTGTVAENANEAQVAYWTVDTVPKPTSTDADILSDAVTAAELTTHFSTELSTINGYYDGVSVLDSWAISINEIASSADNVLAQHARFLDKAGRTDLFAAGDKVMAGTPFSYSVSIEDYEGNDVTIVAAQDVYGVVNQA